eukprot:CAMPEP_0178923284 /NCGR_PEP_ID=MMETSP0786-20121207/16631_1 /TAXON_ID=186022 /ORGANISM="Thalassionema frauenfeldii, Strain CCMP 1798" /LENGTH=633 /DNA_ID=CAMNT_0020597757 /DNA_START=166 /DNA_END=2064 /DNA_ORIENTATION=+
MISMKSCKPKNTLLRAGVRAACFATLLLLYSLHEYFNTNTDRRRLEESSSFRETKEEDPCDEIIKADSPWFCILYLLGVFYMFVAIAIVCDELFVPALEEIASSRHLNLSMDVAGATLMAAGGSAPELFTSIFGTFVQESEVGIGTVVGSAVFNVLFVIAMCALWSKEVLALTWWPLFRDSSYYSLGLIVLGLFVGVVSPNEIELWEAIVLFLMYIVYVVIIYFNKTLYKSVTGCEIDELRKDETEEESSTTQQQEDEEEPRDDPTSSRHLTRAASNRSLISVLTIIKNDDSSSSAPWPGTFRSGILRLLRSSSPMTESVGIGIVAAIAGDVHRVFRKVDVDGNGEVDREELARLFEKLEYKIGQGELDGVMEELDANKDGKITEEDFTVWYIKSEHGISSRVRAMFEFFDTDNSGTINRSKIKTLLETVEPSVSDKDVDEAMTAMYQNGSQDEISFEEFSIWYINSMIYNRQTKRVEAEMKGIFESVELPAKDAGVIAYIKYSLILPIVLVLALSVPDVRRPGRHKYCYISFAFSIIWIGFFSYFMVDWAEIIGHTIGIPSVIMGLTLLAAGTSVPDLLTSVIVARMGEGDMALSSSIGSNIFDILVGLPLPWFCYSAINIKAITIGSENVW